MFDKLTQLLAARAGGMGQKPGMGGHTAQAPGMGMPQATSVGPGFMNKLFSRFGQPSSGGNNWMSGMMNKVPQMGGGMKPPPMQGAPMGMAAPPLSSDVQPMAPPPAAPETPMPESPMADAPMAEPPMRMFDNRRNRVRM